MRRPRPASTLSVLSVLATLALLATTVVMSGLTGASATAADDTTPPVVRLDPWARPLVGAQVGVTHVPDEGFTVWDADFAVHWYAADPSGICDQEVGWSSYDALGEEVDPRIGGPTTYFPVERDARTFTAPHLNLFDWNRVEDRFIVKVTDCAGNVGYSNVADSQFGIHEDAEPAISYRGPWRTAHFDGFAGGTTHATVARGASASVSFSGNAPIALIMETAPNRGKADVYVDGVRRATVDTYAAVTRHRVLVWQGRFGSGPHRLTLVNRATPGHPRIDLDAVSFCPGDGSCLTG